MKQLTTFATILTFIMGFSVVSFGQDTPPPTPPVQHGPGFVYVSSGIFMITVINHHDVSQR